MKHLNMDKKHSKITAGEETTYSYVCTKCGHKEEVPDIVVDAFAASGGLKPGEMPEIECPRCRGTLRSAG